MMLSVVVTHPVNNTCNNSFKARLSILILSKAYPSGEIYLTKL
jgi:hypothetical protein